MSLDALRWAWTVQGLNAAQKLVLLSLADRADEHHVCWPSMFRLAKDTGLHERSVYRQIKSLAQLGIISIASSPGAGNKYRLLGVNDRENTPDASPPLPCQNVTPDNLSPLAGCQDTPDNLPPLPCQNVRGTPDRMPPESKVEPSKNHQVNPQCKRARKSKAEKLTFGRFNRVKLTQEEHDKLIAEHGDRGSKAIDRLDAWIEGKGGDKYKSHYAAMHTWVLRAVDEDETRMQRASPGKYRQGMSAHGNKRPDGRERDYGQSDYGALGEKL